jgi:hypothetical protein
MGKEVYEPKADKWDEVGSEWVEMPDGNLYLLPVCSRDDRLVPVFHDDGSVTFQEQHKDTTLASLAQRFATACLCIDEAEPATKALMLEDSFVSLLKLLRHMLSTNYSFSNEQLSKILTLNTRTVSTLFNNVKRHLARM